MGGTLVVMPGFAEMVGALLLFAPLGGAETGGAGAREALPDTAFAQPAAPMASRPATHGKSPARLDALKVVVRHAGSDGQPQTQGQIRIEQRVIVRIAPRSVSTRRNLLAQLPVRARNYEEIQARSCVPVSQISAVETGSGNRLLLFTRDTGILSVRLEKACRARDFYSGFYVERNTDGKLCADRDTLQSRNGARCNISSMMQMQAVEE
jgi:hypothetical protein